MASASTYFWETTAFVLAMAAAGLITIPLMDDIFMPTESQEVQEIVVRISVNEAGGFDPDEIRVKKGQPVKLTLISMDVPHGFAIDSLGINVTDITVEKPAVVEFTPEEKGSFMFKCVTQCSPLHHFLRGVLIVED